MDATQRAADETAANGHEKTHYGSHAGHGMHAGHAMPDREPKHHGHDAHAGHSVGMFRDKFWVSLLLTLPTLVWGHMLQRAFGYTAPHFPGSDWIPAAFGTAVFAYGGWVFIQGAACPRRRGGVQLELHHGVEPHLPGAGDSAVRALFQDWSPQMLKMMNKPARKASDDQRPMPPVPSRA